MVVMGLSESLESQEKVPQYGDTLEKIREFIDSLDASGDVEADRLRLIFDLLNDELVEKLDDKTQTQLEKVSLERGYLSGLNTRRSETEILAFILKIAKGGAKKTKILYQANLSGRQLKNYMNFLLDTGFLREKRIPKKGSFFNTTKKGDTFLFHWMKILNLLEMQTAN
jgi:predicted transcriptional regulator